MAKPEPPAYNVEELLGIIPEDIKTPFDSREVCPYFAPSYVFRFLCFDHLMFCLILSMFVGLVWC